jgi:hypothetical protein
MSGLTAHWFQSFKHSLDCYQWDVFVAAVVEEFEVDTRRALTMRLIGLKQVGSVADYRKEFEQLVYHIRLFVNSLSETMLTAQFLMGLKDNIRMKVKLLLPESVAKAATLTAVQETLEKHNK